MRLYEFELTKNSWELLISNSDKEELGHDLVSLVKHAYSSTPDGSFVNSIQDVIPSDWDVIDWDGDPDVDACVFFRKPRAGERWTGHKIQGLGHDGTRPSKDRALAKIQSMLHTPGNWIESSDAMRHILKTMNCPIVKDVRVLQTLFNDPHLKMIDADTYTRNTGNKQLTETVFGHPHIR